ncbi:porin, partial [Microvirga subterranea]
AYAGQRAPDVVANIKYVGTWGGAQLSGAVHQLRSDNLFTSPITGFSDFPDTEYGFAISGTAHVNLPMLAPGDAAWIAATYARGAVAYLNGGNSALNSSPFNVIGVGGPVALVDAVVNATTGDIDTTTGWSVAGGLRHYWTPQLRQNVFGSYMRIEYGSGAQAINPAGFTVGLADFNEWRLGTNLIWQPVSGLDLGVEVMYVNLDPRGRAFIPSFTPGVPGVSYGSDSAWEGRLRVQRDF